ncbi:MAG: VOC family protein [Rhizobiaceae bacterium]
MIDHCGLSVSDFDKAKSFYDQALAPIGASMLFTVPTEHTGGVKVGGYGRDRPTFWINEGQPQNPTLHIAFTAQNRAEVEAFYAAALAAGGMDNGPPGPRPHYHEHYYGAFVLDLDGNNIEAVCHLPE